MKYIAPTPEEWRPLLAAAENFKKAACWNWMDACDIFGVKCPETGEIYYCSIMGGGGEHLGLAAYRGTPGLNTLLQIMAGELAPAGGVYEQNCLSCSFEDRELLEKEDLQVIKSLALKLRGRKQWPQFRDYTPGLYPWFINSSQCRTLTHVMQQALDVSLRCRLDKNIVYRQDLRLFVRVAQAGGKENPVWIDRYLEPAPVTVELPVFRFQDQAMVRALKDMRPDVKFKVEADIFYIPEPVQEDGRPYFPQLCVMLERGSGMLVANEMVANIKDEGYLFLSALLEVIIESGRKPSDLYVAKPEVRALFEGLCRQIGIRLHVVELSQALKEFRSEIEAHFTG